MRLLESEAKSLFRDNGIPVPEGMVISSPDELKLEGKTVVKAQIPAGRRGKAGGVLFCENLDEARTRAGELLGSSLLGYDVEKVLVEQALETDREFFLAATYDTANKVPAIILSPHGGVDIEELAEKHPEQIFRTSFNILEGFGEHRARELVSDAGLSGKDLMRISGILHRLVNLFLKWDATIAEINPLVKTSDGQFMAVDGHIDIEDDALYRHPELESKYGIPKRETVGRQPTKFEIEAAKIDSQDHRGVAGRMVEFDGNIGLLIGGGGASLTAFDAIRKHGGRPANYCEIGGNPSVKKIRELTRLMLSRPGVEKIAVIMNVVSNTRVDLVARGIIKGIHDLNQNPSERIAIFRIPGSYEGDGFKILEKHGVNYCDRTVSIDEAARQAVEAFK